MCVSLLLVQSSLNNKAERFCEESEESCMTAGWVGCGVGGEWDKHKKKIENSTQTKKR